MTAKQEKIIQLLESYRKEVETPTFDQFPEVEQAINCIHSNLFDLRLTVSWLKDQCHINRGSFSARFKTCIGSYPKEYILRHRLEAGKLLLKKTEASVTTIGIMIGFNSLSAFCKSFKRKVDQRPSEWRNNFAAKE